MFTSRAEYRLLLRADNADSRLTERGAAVGVVSDERLAAWEAKKRAIERAEAQLHAISLPSSVWAKVGVNINPEGNALSAADALALAGATLTGVEGWVRDVARLEADEDVGGGHDGSKSSARRVALPAGMAADGSTLVEPAARETVEVSLKYREALKLQQRSIERVRRSSGRELPDDLDYTTIQSLNCEEVEKLTAARPRTLHEASEISGITPNALSSVLQALRSRDKQQPRPAHVGVKQRRKAMARAAMGMADAEGGGGAAAE